MASKGPASETAGVKPMAIAGRLVRERERLFGMTDAERAWRKQWLKDQILAPHEPVHVPQYHQELTNPIRRFYQWPLNKLWEKLTPALGHYRAYTIRFWAGKGLMTLTALYLGFYYFKYNQNDWTRKGGWRVIESRKAVVPGDPGYPAVSDRTKPADYASRGFKESPI
ncbi:NADH dehydrogenase [ubiquinone] 1 beta subcomplex subunit 6 [Phlebotomus argentipes]|uniref:NADH dehydrogenase [ubiquinone] 1 beta subcomplex subunit 6 n=1 Tax=Phlebotomus argentipes TaxID=94469 RepID=UPI002892CA1F|nr:NADH dehydrogenase [ubiquinone] 1 beta subcomplex subunit 6 [Phlebotomus argentipes]